MATVWAERRTKPTKGPSSGSFSSVGAVKASYILRDHLATTSQDHEPATGWRCSGAQAGCEEVSPELASDTSRARTCALQYIINTTSSRSEHSIVDNARLYVRKNYIEKVVQRCGDVKIIDSEFSELNDLSGGRARGTAEVRKIVSAIAPISKKVNSTTLLYGLSAACYNLSHREAQPGDYALGRRELLQDASDIAWAIAAVADKSNKVDMPGLLSAFVAILGKLD